MARKYLYLIAMHAVNKILELKSFHDRLVAKRKKPMTAQCACMQKILLILQAMVIENRLFDEKIIKRTIGFLSDLMHIIGFLVVRLLFQMAAKFLFNFFWYYILKKYILAYIIIYRMNCHKIGISLIRLSIMDYLDPEG